MSYIASALLGKPLYMDSVTASRERLEYAKVCVEIDVYATIPKFVDVLLRDGRVHPVRVVMPWLLPSCPKCKIYGHVEEICSVKDARSVQVLRPKGPIAGGNEAHGLEPSQSSKAPAIVVKGNKVSVSQPGQLSESAVVVSSGVVIDKVDKVVDVFNQIVNVDVAVSTAIEVVDDVVFLLIMFNSLSWCRKKEGRGRPAKAKKDPAQEALILDLKNRKKVVISKAKVVTEVSSIVCDHSLPIEC
ncbi:hypothetical protein V6N13_109411 [Hibiscus sabdariffa]